jgi:acyl carrier protein
MKVLAGLPTQVVAMNLDADRWCSTSTASTRSHFLDSLRRSTEGAPGPGTDGLAEFGSTQGDELRNRLVGWLRRQVAAVLRLDVDRVPEDKPVRSLGLDSLMALELRNRLERHLHMKLSATLVWNYPTVGKIAEFLQKRMEESRQKGRSDDARPLHVEAAPAEERVLATTEAHSASEMLAAELLEAETLLNTQTGAL